MGDFMKKILGANWKTTGAAILVFLLSVPSVVSAITAWAQHQTPDWRMAILGIVTGLGLLAAKDSTTHSTAAQVENSTVANSKVEQVAKVEGLSK